MELELATTEQIALELGRRHDLSFVLVAHRLSDRNTTILSSLGKPTIVKVLKRVIEEYASGQYEAYDPDPKDTDDDCQGK